MYKNNLSLVWRILFALVFAFSLAGLSTHAAGALDYDVINLNDSGAASLRQAILDANASAGADTITFSVSGTITLASSLPDVSGDLTIDGSGQTITISGNDLVRVLLITPGMNVTLRHLTIANGRSSFDVGGGVKNGGTLTVDDCTFSDNWGLDAGAIYSSGSLSVINSTFQNNTASQIGGAIDVFNSSLTVYGSTFSGNHSTQSAGGIALFQTTGTATATIANSTFTANTTDFDGGGIWVYYGTLTLVNSTLSGNGALDSGGGLNDYGGTVHIKNTILANSTSGLDCTSSLGLATSLNNLFESGYNCGTSVTTLDPNLGPLGNNGGLTQTFALLAGSPAVDVGDDATCSGGLVNNLDQRGVPRTYGTHCDIGSYEQKKGSLTFRSLGTRDGYVLESGENTNVGGTIDSTAATFILGDGAQDKQYRAILHFNSGSLPDNAVITKATLKIRKQGVLGTNPFTILGRLIVDIRKPFFGSFYGLEARDFQAAAGRNAVSLFGITPVNYWYSANLNAIGRAYVNKTGVTQFRLRFATDDNNDNAADYMRFCSGNYATLAPRPTLIVEYYVP